MISFKTSSSLRQVYNHLKESGREINYGSGKSVGEETIAGAREPLRINWYGGSYIEVPVLK